MSSSSGLGPASVSCVTSACGFNATGEGGGTEKKGNINPELWQACAGPLMSLPAAGTLVYYFPQGHSEQVAASMRKDIDAQIPNYPNLPSKLLCLLHSVTLHADPETDDVYAQMTLQPVPSYDREALLRSDLSLKSNKPQTEFFCKTLTASDTSTHGGFSVPRRAAEKIFPPLDFTLQPPAQEFVARDLHNNAWTFRHIYRGEPKRHLLTTGWSLFVGGKRLFAGDSVLFIRDEKQHLLLGVKRANRQSSNLSSSVLSSDSMHIGILAAAAHAAANNSPFNIYYNPRASPSEFVIPLAKYYKAVCSNQISLGMRFRMTFETEDSGTRRYMGTVTGITDLDPVRWKNSQWRNLQVGWDESTAGERRNRVSVWEIEPVTAPFFLCPPPFFRCKRPRQPGVAEDESGDLDALFKRGMPWYSDDLGLKDCQQVSGLSLAQWMNVNMQQSSSAQLNYGHPFSSSLMKSISGADQFAIPSLQSSQSITFPLTNQMMSQQSTQASLSPPCSIMKPPPQQQFTDISHRPRLNLVGQTQAQTQCSQMIGQPCDDQLQLQILQKIQQQEALHAQQTRLQTSGGGTQLDDASRNAKPNQILSQQFQNSVICSGTMMSAGAGHSIITDEGPSCSTSPSANNFEAIPCNPDVSQKLCVKPSMYVSNMKKQAFMFPRGNGAEFLDTSSTTSLRVCGNAVDHGSSIAGNMFGEGDAGVSKLCTENWLDVEQEVALSVISQELGLADVRLGGRAPAQLQPMRSYKKVYKRGAVGRLVDISGYSGYEDLKQDVARRFGIQGQLEDKQRIGWKLVYVDLENDILLVGDDPWEEFVNCVKCIKILSPQEVQQMSLDGDLGASAHQNHTCSTSENGSKMN